MPVTPGFFDFLVENRLHDSKAWFEEHRKEYQRLVLEPLRGLVTEMAPVMLELDPQLVVQPRRSGSSRCRNCGLTWRRMGTPTAAAGTARAPS